MAEAVDTVTAVNPAPSHDAQRAVATPSATALWLPYCEALAMYLCGRLRGVQQRRAH
ncbi:hypothetical protein [Rhodoferax sp.]|uniref:hypothetical protein n=1 Tax=Rhodoferax sp. TaxID=50421 RepID=UPI0026098206|nr:hypothetical protein [Rhodoferax sp.]MDD2919314.1 hypothetical protein [Rhodoferax sp.]